MTPRIHQTGSDHWNGRRPPISDADRIARHGPLQPMMEAPVMNLRGLVSGVVWTLLLLVVVVIGSAVLP